MHWTIFHGESDSGQKVWSVFFYFFGVSYRARINATIVIPFVICPCSVDVRLSVPTTVPQGRAHALDGGPERPQQIKRSRYDGVHLWSIFIKAMSAQVMRPVISDISTFPICMGTLLMG
jgi:hypothetical protein